MSLGAIYSESSRERESAGSTTKDTDVVGSLLFLGGQDSSHHTGGQAKNGQTLDNKVQPQKIQPDVVGKIQDQIFKGKAQTHYLKQRMECCLGIACRTLKNHLLVVAFSDISNLTC